MIEHLTLLLPPQSQLTFSVGLAVGVLLGGCVIEYYGHMRKVKNDKNKVYGRLKGEKRLVTQLYTSVADYAIIIEYNDALKNYLIDSEKYKNHPKALEIIRQFDRDDPDLRKRYDDRIIELAKVRERMWKDIGLAEILFKNSKLSGVISIIETSEENLENFIDNLETEIANERFDDHVSEVSSSLLRVDQLWRKKKEGDLKTYNTSLEHAIDGLLNEIKRML